KYSVPRMAFVNKMDRMGADFFNVVQEMRDNLGARPVAVTLPIGSGEDFEGVIDLLRMKAIHWDMQTMGANFTESEIPDELKEQAQSYRETLLEAATSESGD
ncbi:MAG: elongation factor G, partial [Thiohalorhabdaceae bacterium]